jgi:hypothetical protein
MKKFLILTTALVLTAAACNQQAQVNNGQNQTNQNPQQTNTTNWKVYSNTQYRYSFKYPNESSWSVTIPGPSNLSLEKSTEVVVSSGSNLVFYVDARDTSLISSQNIAPKMAQVWRLSLKDYAQKIWQDNKDSVKSSTKQVSNLEEINLDGKKAYRFILTESYVSDDIDGGYSLSGKNVYVVAENNGVKLLIHYPESSMGNSIFSTFKLTN